MSGAQGHCAVCKAPRLQCVETVKAIALHPYPFTVDNDLLTLTFKLNGHDVKKAFLPTIKACVTSGTTMPTSTACKL
ncbi:hypothetical protein H257_17914 [Aphanomyces astaci]|uniref:Uncharacterized protein n=1 Tax=Aphanomyces astaci TaxID=112090 RepID=W4FF04_APHAT|nr:hypothetical protein H257_17914 [Aphanomyces astaci]ETV65313.1 hypothetical protein H257_17914 [Aphanomyces astaci]|eukprot:XP_009845179.1 hypothetical protein H257_17914 [Aphanomyces astaci]